MLEDNKCRNACCRHWSELEGNCARNATFMDGFCPGACAEEAARVALRKSAFDGDYEKQWEHGMALMDAHDSEGYYWICRRAPASRGRGAFREPSRGDAARSRRRLGPRGARSRAATRSSSWSARPRSRRGRSASATRRRASATARSSTSGSQLQPDFNVRCCLRTENSIDSSKNQRPGSRGLKFGRDRRPFPAQVFDEWLAPLKDLEGYDDDEVPVLQIIADYIFDARDDDYKKHGSPVVKKKKAWRISDAPEDNPDQLHRTKLAERGGSRVAPPDERLTAEL